MKEFRRVSLPLLKKLQKERSSRVLSYVLGDSKPFATKIADDAVPIMKNHLQRIGRQKLISLFLYTTGGDMITPLRIVNLIREYCDKLEVLIPGKAQSAGTLLCLGADKIVMGPSGELSPIDPMASHPFNPKDPDTKKPLPVSVEDVNSYFLFAEEQVKLKDQDLVKAFESLVAKLHPLALGNIYRGYRMARILGEKLLNMHMDSKKEGKRIDLIVDNVTKKIPVHGYPISRKEAKEELGLKIEFANSQLDKRFDELFAAYAEFLTLGKAFDPLKELGSEENVKKLRPGALIESEVGLDVFLFEMNITKITAPDGRSVPKVNISPEWKGVE